MSRSDRWSYEGLISSNGRIGATMREMVHAIKSRSDAVGNKPRRFADCPRITIRALMCLVLIIALSNGLCMISLGNCMLPDSRLR